MQLLVLGMHRSGTSGVTRLLNMAGAWFGPEGISTGANEQNRKGFWERRDVRDMCDALLRGGGFDWWRVSRFDLDAIPEAVRENQLKVFRKIVLELDAHRPWVLKEPRLCLLLPLLKPVLEVPIFIHVVREPLEVAASVHARSGFSRPAALGLWELYTIRSLEASAGMPRLLVRYDELTADPVATTTRLLDELADLGVQGLRRPTEREITAFITPDLHHQRRSAEVRGLHLNQQQAQIAAAIDDGTVFDAPLPSAVSEGALESLVDFEEAEDRLSRLSDIEERIAAAAADRDRLHQKREQELRRVAPAVAGGESPATEGRRGARHRGPGGPHTGRRERPVDRRVPGVVAHGSADGPAAHAHSGDVPSTTRTVGKGARRHRARQARGEETVRGRMSGTSGRERVGAIPVRERTVGHR